MISKKLRKLTSLFLAFAMVASVANVSARDIPYADKVSNPDVQMPVDKTKILNHGIFHCCKLYRLL